MNKFHLLKKTTSSISNQILTNKSSFFISFYSHYIFKSFNTKNPIKFPKSKFKYQNIELLTRENTIDFWACLETYEPDLTYFLIEVLKNKKGTFIDVGGHIGRFTVLMAKNNWNVLTFEPVLSNYNMILNNLKHNNCSENVKIMNCGLGDINQSQTIYFNSSELGESSVIESKDKKEKLDIEIISFDSIYKNFKLDELCVVKIDIEGNEEKALIGMKDFIANHKPLLILELWEDNFKNVKQFLKENGYKRLHIFWFIEEKHTDLIEQMYNLYNKSTIIYNYE